MNNTSSGQIGFSAAVVRVVMQDRDIIERLRNLFGGRLRERKYTHGVYPQWQVCGSRARGVIMTIYPFLGKRRRIQARAVLAL